MRKISSRLPFGASNVCAPVNTALPSIMGLGQVGLTLTAVNGAWTGNPTSFTYHWQNEGSPISGATSSTYVLQTSDLGALISVQVIAANNAGASVPAISALAGPVISTTVYYVSFSAGNDSNTGTDTAHPWKTVAKVNGFSFPPGASVLFNRGDRWDRSAGPSVIGTLWPKAAGTAGNPIVYDAYGTGANPIIDGSADASQTSAWTNIGTNLWQSVQTFAPWTATTVTITIASPAVVTWGINGPFNGSSVVFATKGALPTGITAGTIYYVVNASGTTFQISATFGGAAINTSGSQSGTQTAGASGLPYHNANDIGNLLWGFSPLGGSAPAAVNSASFGNMVGAGTGGVWYSPGEGTTTLASTATQGNWNFNTDNFKVQVYSVGNPATAMPGLRLAMDADAAYINNSDYTIIQNITFQNQGASGVTVLSNNVIVRDNVIQWIGGGNNGGASNANSRYGDGSNPIGNYDTIRYERNFFYQMYDGAISPQNGGTPHNNLTIRNNVFNHHLGAVVVLNSPGSGINVQSGLFIYNNTAFGNSSWSVGQRPNANAPNLSVEMLYDSTVAVSNTDMRNNIWAGNACTNQVEIFLNQATCLSPGGVGGLTCNLAVTLPMTTWDYNNWHQFVPFGAAPNIGMAGSGGNFSLATWAANHGFETHGLIGMDPSFVNQSAGGLALTVGSPLRNAGTNLYSAGVVWDFNHKPRPVSGPFTMGAFQ
jgi:hypothetical protein